MRKKEKSRKEKQKQRKPNNESLDFLKWVFEGQKKFSKSCILCPTPQHRFLSISLSGTHYPFRLNLLRSLQTSDSLILGQGFSLPFAAKFNSSYFSLRSLSHPLPSPSSIVSGILRTRSQSDQNLFSSAHSSLFFFFFQMSYFNFNDLPTEVQSLTFRHLEPVERALVLPTCQEWNQLIMGTQ